jgi:hypothetical protein
VPLVDVTESVDPDRSYDRPAHEIGLGREAHASKLAVLPIACPPDTAWLGSGRAAGRVVVRPS